MLALLIQFGDQIEPELFQQLENAPRQWKQLSKKMFRYAWNCTILFDTFEGFFFKKKAGLFVTVAVKLWHPFKMRRQLTCASKVMPLARRSMFSVLIFLMRPHLGLLTVEFTQRM